MKYLKTKWSRQCFKVSQTLFWGLGRHRTRTESSVWTAAPTRPTEVGGATEKTGRGQATRNELWMCLKSEVSFFVRESRGTLGCPPAQVSTAFEHTVAPSALLSPPPVAPPLNTLSRPRRGARSTPLARTTRLTSANWLHEPSVAREGGNHLPSAQ